MKPVHLSALLACVVVSSASVASADSKAWSTAAANLPGDTPLAIGVDVQALQKSATYAKFLPLLTDKPEVKNGLDLIKANCKIDALNLISSVAIAGSASTDEAVMFISMPGFDQKKAITCLQAVATAKDKSTKITVTNDGNIAELSDGKDKLYVGFIGEVAVIAPKKMEDKASLKKWITGAGAFGKGNLGKLLAKVNTSAAVFGGSTETKQMASSGYDVKSAFGSLTLVSGTVGVELHGIFGDATAATKRVDDANTQLAQVKQNPPLPALKGLLSTLTVAANGTDAVMKASAKEQDIVDLVQMLLMMSGGGGGGSAPSPSPMSPH